MRELYFEKGGGEVREEEHISQRPKSEETIGLLIVFVDEVN